LWRYLNGKSVCREWAVYEQMLQHMSERNRVALPRERLREIQTLWRRAVIRAGELRAERRAGGPVPSVVVRGQPEDRPRTEGIAPLVIHDGEVTILDPVVITGRTVEIRGGTVRLGSTAAMAAAQIVVHGGKVVLGDQGDQPQVYPAVADPAA